MEPRGWICSRMNVDRYAPYDDVLHNAGWHTSVVIDARRFFSYRTAKVANKVKAGPSKRTLRWGQKKRKQYNDGYVNKAVHTLLG
jgi:hypothetical protein